VHSFVHLLEQQGQKKFGVSGRAAGPYFPLNRRPSDTPRLRSLPSENPRRPRDSATASAVAQRVLELRKPDEADAEFARRIGLSPTKIANYRAGGGISVDALALVVERTQANPRWLLLGTGPRSLSRAAVEASLDLTAEGAISEMKLLLAALEERLDGGQQSSAADLNTSNGG
jgi:hypothetical protein